MDKKIIIGLWILGGLGLVFLLIGGNIKSLTGKTAGLATERSSELRQQDWQLKDHLNLLRMKIQLK